MAVTKLDPHDLWTAKASVDLSAHQYGLVKLTSTGELALAGAGENGFVLQDAPKQDEWGTIALPGPIVKGVLGGTVAAGEHLTGGASGTVVKAETGNAIVGTALTSGVSGEVATFTSHPTGAKA